LPFSPDFDVCLEVGQQLVIAAKRISGFHIADVPMMPFPASLSQRRTHWPRTTRASRYFNWCLEPLIGLGARQMTISTKASSARTWRSCAIVSAFMLESIPTAEIDTRPLRSCSQTHPFDA
jgi:hypothetical protein